MSVELVDEIVELASIPAPTFAEERRLEWIERRLADAPGSRARDEAGNLLWRLGDGRPSVALLAHVDTVFPEDAPLAFGAEAGLLTGPGIGDNAAAVVTVVPSPSRSERRDSAICGAPMQPVTACVRRV